MDNLVEHGQRFYDENLKSILEPDQIGRFVAIEPEMGRYFLGHTGSVALVAARTAMPNSLFYLMRVGYETADRVRPRMI